MREIKQGLTFDDVLLIPQKTSVKSRQDVDISSYLTPKIKLQVPFISANMDSATEHKMAIAMAKMGAIGFIHRFLTIEQEAEEIQKVKKEDPSANSGQGLLVGAAIGINGDIFERSEALLKAGSDVLVLDIAHGHSEHLLSSLRELKKKFPKVEVVAGNVATGKGAFDLIQNGADAVKVGVGPGAQCSTRIVTGAGVPQLSAIMDAVEVAKKYKIPVIADGGIRYSADVVKALAAGASTVMWGSQFSACEESPAPLVEQEGKQFKVVRGMASYAANKERVEKGIGKKTNMKLFTAEGVEQLVPFKGSVVDLLTQYIGGVRSGLSYCGAHTIEELWQKAEFIQITQAALAESFPHKV